MDITSIEFAVGVLTIIGILGTWFNIVALKPLRLAIESLNVAIGKLEKSVESSLNDRRELWKKVKELEANSSSHMRELQYLSNRVDRIGDRVSICSRRNGED